MEIGKEKKKEKKNCWKNKKNTSRRRLHHLDQHPLEQQQPLEQLQRAQLEHLELLEQLGGLLRCKKNKK